MKSVLKPYFGPLTLEEIHTGMEAARSNAERLLEDATILMEAMRYPSACALAILAIEERGKVAILKHFALQTLPNDARRLWKEYRSHRNKNMAWILPELAAKGARTLEAIKDTTNPDAEHTFLLDGLKQISFYSDCLGNGNWSLPETVISEEVAGSMILIANSMRGREMTVRELQLWQEHVGPNYGKSNMAAAVLNFQDAIYREGLSKTTPESLAAFMSGKAVEIKTESPRQQ